MKNENKKLHNQDDVNPTTQQDKIQEILKNGGDEPLPLTSGTGSNPQVPRNESLKITKDEEE